ncbi:MAG: hypothetical protein A2Y40_03935 [Candidatus Margulisbacteria bacterium GWF2_35_9]|nr:MAG: hypothetical protein A2Y40_03935 [Candidatus Margulisbacteria bacterium GWF2_35_9]
MELTVQILTIIVDVLIIIFFLLMIIMALLSIKTMRKISKFVDNLSDLHFWLSIFKKIPTSLRKKK